MNYIHLIILLAGISSALIGCKKNVDAGYPLEAPVVFAPETISVGNVYRGTISPDGEEFYFFKQHTEGQEDYRIYLSKRVEGEWSDPHIVQLHGEYSDLYPALSFDGQRMAFSSYRPIPGDTSVSQNANLWYVDREGSSWGEPVFMGIPSTLDQYDAKPFFGKDNEIYFESTLPDWSQTYSLVTQWNGSAYGDPFPFEPVEQWRDWRNDLYVWGGILSPDGNVLILDVSHRNEASGEAGASDQWLSRKNEDGSWAEPVRLDGGFNSEGYDNFTFFSPEGDRLFFVRDFDMFYTAPLSSIFE